MPSWRGSVAGNEAREGFGVQGSGCPGSDTTSSSALNRPCWWRAKHLEGIDMQPRKLWTEQCEAARGIEDDFGTQKALDYLVGEKFLNFLEAAETHAEFRAEVPAFVAEIKSI